VFLVDSANAEVHVLFSLELINLLGGTMPDLHYLRTEIARMRLQVGRQRREIRGLEEAGIGTDSANALLQRMMKKIETLSADRDRLIQEEKLNSPTYASGKRINGTPAQRRS
jgi:hypothetical protein